MAVIGEAYATYILWSDNKGAVALTRKEHLACVSSAIMLCLRAGGVKPGMELLKKEYDRTGHELASDYAVWAVHSPNSLKDWIKDHTPLLNQIWQGL